MILDKIGFYTLSEERCHRVATDPNPILSRCEILLTSRCNFRCPYCRNQGGRDLTKAEVINTLDLWIKDSIQAVRFSGGEPTMWPYLAEVVKYCQNKIPRIAISSNRSAKWHVYQELIDAGANDFSISLDACCASDGHKMAGVKFDFEAFLDNIRNLSKQVYTTVGIVLTSDNIQRAIDTIKLADTLGVSDIRIIPAAQYSAKLELPDLPQNILDKYPILSFRWSKMQQNLPVRGIISHSANKCPLVLDDMAVMQGKHYPCIIYLREGGKEIGEVSPNMRLEREQWYKTHNPFSDPICAKNCLDFCQEYNKRIEQIKLDHL